MTEHQESLGEAIEEVAGTAEETAQVVDDASDLGEAGVQGAQDLAAEVAGSADEVIEETDSLAEGFVETVGDSEGAAGEGFEERLEGFVSDAGNFMARDIYVDHDADEGDKLWSLAAYLSQIIIPVIVPVLMLVIEPNKDRPFQKYHAVQSLGFLVAEFVYQILAGIVFAILSVVTLGCLTPILWLIFLLPIIPAIYYAYLAYQGKRFKMPWLTDFMSGQDWL